LIDLLVRIPGLQRVARRTADWIDLAWWFLDADLKRAAPHAHGRLLDVGCGAKPYEHIFRPYVTDYIGIEHEATFAKTSASLSDRKPDLVYDGTRLPFDDRTFDTVLNAEVLEHTPRPAALVAEMARVLKDDGILIIAAPFQFRLHEQPHDYFRYTPHGLRSLCTDAGLEVLDVHHQGSLWSVVAHKLNSYLAFRIARIGGLAQSMGKLPHEGPTAVRPRLWTLPFVAPSMMAFSATARVMDRFLFEPEESLGYSIVARRKRATPVSDMP
jgi:SAM-dependent methyltransferase